MISSVMANVLSICMSITASENAIHHAQSYLNCVNQLSSVTELKILEVDEDKMTSGFTEEERQVLALEKALQTISIEVHTK